MTGILITDFRKLHNQLWQQNSVTYENRKCRSSHFLVLVERIEHLDDLRLINGNIVGELVRTGKVKRIERPSVEELLTHNDPRVRKKVLRYISSQKQI